MSLPSTLEVPEGYHETDVGIIPNDWEVSNIGSVLSITTGSRNTQDKLSNGLYPFFVRSQTIERINSYSFDGEAVLTAGDGVGTGKIFHYINGKFDFHQRVYLMYNFGEKVDGYYFYIYFSNFFYDRIMSMTAKSSVDSVRREMIADMLIILPSLKEQTAIANALSDVDALLTELEKLIAKKQAIKTATMQQLLTGLTRLPQFATHTEGEKKGQAKGTKPSELGEIPEDWEVVTLDEAANFLDGQRRPIKSGDRARIKGQYPYYGASGIVDYVNDFIFDGEFILLGEDGENILSRSLPLAFKASGKIWVNNHAHVMTPKKNYHIDFLIPYLESLDYSLLNSGTAQPKLNKQSCLNIKVIKPSIEEQTAIATILSDMDEQIQTLEQRLKKTRQIKQGMMQELLTGRTRLI